VCSAEVGDDDAALRKAMVQRLLAGSG